MGGVSLQCLASLRAGHHCYLVTRDSQEKSSSTVPNKQRHTVTQNISYLIRKYSLKKMGFDILSTWLRIPALSLDQFGDFEQFTQFP